MSFLAILAVNLRRTTEDQFAARFLTQKPILNEEVSWLMHVKFEHLMTYTKLETSKDQLRLKRGRPGHVCGRRLNRAGKVSL